MNAITVTHNNFEKATEFVVNGNGYFKAGFTIIDAKVIARFKKIGFEVVHKDKDGKGFRIQSGKKLNYVPVNQLILVEYA